MIKCIVHNCENHEHEGSGKFMVFDDYNDNGKRIEWICMPCFTYLTTGERGHSAIEQDFIREPAVWPPKKGNEK